MELIDKDAGAILAAMRSGEVTCQEVMAATLARIAAVNGEVNAIVSLRDPDELMREARAADAAPPKGPLHGLPFAVKDLARLSGVLCSQGSPLFANDVPDQDETMVARLRAAGAIFLGKTNVPEFGLGSHSYNPVFGVTRNPFNLSRTAGGSSGGAGAALATGMVALADGSDMMGSLRNPAAFCNVYGFRPSWGVVPREPGGETFQQQLSTLGPMARCPADLGILMSVMAGPNPLVPHNAPAQDWTVKTSGSLQGLRVGWLSDWGGAYPTEPGILDICQTGLMAIGDLGAVVEDVSPPFSAAELWDSWVTLRHWAIAAEQSADYDDPERRAFLKPELIWEVEQGLALNARDISRAGAVRARWFASLSLLLQDFDVLALPSSQVWPFPAEWDWPKTINGQVMDTYHRWMDIVVPVSLSGVPCVNVPVGFGKNGLPMGMQLMARKGRDLELLNWAQCYHDATGWPNKRP